MKKFLKITLIFLGTLVLIAGGFLGYKFLTLPDINGSEPAWSTTCEQLAFVAEREDGYQIYVMDPSLGKVDKVTKERGKKHYPVWSPNGNSLAFCQKRDGDWWISSLDLSTLEITHLVETHTFNPMRPSWVSGSELVYPSEKSGDKEIWKYNLRTGRETRLTGVEGDDSYPHFVTSLNKIAFTSYRDGNSEIYLMNVDGSAQTRITDNKIYDGRPWSDDSGNITYSSKEGGTRSINRISTNGEITTLVQYENRIHYPTTCGSGEKIIFTSDAQGDFALYEYDVEGGQTRRIQPI